MGTNTIGVVWRHWSGLAMASWLASLTQRARRLRRGRGEASASSILAVGTRLIHRWRRWTRMNNVEYLENAEDVGVGMYCLRPLHNLCALCVRKVPARFSLVARCFGWASLLGVGFLADAGFGRERAVVRLDTGLVVVPFAVPVATPVAVVQPGGAYYVFGPREAEGEATLRAEFEAFRRWRQEQLANNAENTARAAAEDSLPREDADRARSLVAEHCLACHRGPQAKGGVRLDGRLSSDARLAAMRAVLAGKMPKGKTLADDVAGELLYELTEGVSRTSAKGE